MIQEEKRKDRQDIINTAKLLKAIPESSGLRNLFGALNHYWYGSAGTELLRALNNPFGRIDTFSRFVVHTILLDEEVEYCIEKCVEAIQKGDKALEEQYDAYACMAVQNVFRGFVFEFSLVQTHVADCVGKTVRSVIEKKQ